MYSVALNLPANEQVIGSIWENWELEESFDFQYSLFKMHMERFGVEAVH